MSEIRTEIEIHAPAERVWQVLTDFPRYCQWNSVLCPVQGEAKAGERLKVRVRPRSGPAMTLRVTVLQAKLDCELRWKGQFLHPALFAGEHSFTIEPVETSGVRFVQREVYTGLLAPVVMLALATSNRRVFEEMNKALKERVEQGPQQV